MSSPSYQLTPIVEEELSVLAANASHAFAVNDQAGAEVWLRTAPLEDHRVVRTEENGPILASMLRIPDGVYVRGRVVPCLGIAGVVVPPEGRRGGLARAMMELVLREARERNEALSMLFPSTQALYRKVGYEAAGYLFTLRTRLGRWGSVDEGLEVRPLEEGPPACVRECYAKFAGELHGMMERHSYLWSRVEFRRTRHFKGWGLFADDGTLEAYAYVQQRNTGDAVLLSASDFAYTTPRGARSLLAFLGSFGTVSEWLEFSAGPAHPLLHLLEHQRFEADFCDYWMLRIVHVEKALTLRGWPPFHRCAFALDLRDELFPEHTGTWLVELEHGVASVQRTSDAKVPTVRLDERALAALYTGYLTPKALAELGLLVGDRAALSLVGEAFAAPVAWHMDPF